LRTTQQGTSADDVTGSEKRGMRKLYKRRLQGAGEVRGVRTWKPPPRPAHAHIIPL
jgi:hypothetical protein